MPIHGYTGNIITANPTAPTISSASGVWTTEQQLQAVSQGNWPGYVYPIERSLRFNSADTPYLDRSVSTSGNLRKWTVSCWVKRSKLGSDSYLFTQTNEDGSGANIKNIIMFFNSSNQLRLADRWGSSPGDESIVTNAVFRDTSAWYHVVFVRDSDNATAADRAIIYVNGVRQSVTGSYTQSKDSSWNLQTTAAYGGQQIGRLRFAGAWYYGSDFYMTEVHSIDGQALTPSDFGQTNPQTGVWMPKRYTGSYGTNGFYLNFSDNSGTTSTTLGKDYSGNGNNWTPNNFSVTAGAGNDSLVDTPTPYGTDTGAGGEVRGNYATLNPLTTNAGTYTQGNLQYVSNAVDWRRSNGTVAVSTGKWYWEVTLANAPFSPRGSLSLWNAFGFGVSTSFGSLVGPNSQTDAVVLADNGYYKNFSGSWTDGGTTFSSGDTLSVAVDLDANTYTFRRNNTQIATGTIGGTAGRELVPIIISYGGSYGVMDCNFGQRPFAYTAPSGFKALCTTNLPTPTIGATSTTQAGKYMNVILWSGNNSYPRALTGVGFQPDLVWVKSRTNAYSHVLYDAVRGTGTSKSLYSNETSAEGTNSANANLTSFDADGFTVGSTSGTNILNTNSGVTYVAWNWNAGGSTVTNTAGTITSSVRANTTAGFSIVTYTGTGANATVGHGLGVAPSMVIYKLRTGTTTAPGWVVWHKNLATPTTGTLRLNTTASEDNAATYFNSTIPSSTVFSLGSSVAVNESTSTYVAYVFAEVAGYSKFGSYTGNGSTDGVFVYTGFRPKYVMIKRTDTTADWVIYDSARDTYNVEVNTLYPNLSNAEGVVNPAMDFLSNGIKFRNLTSTFNASSGTYIYAAFAETPFNYSLAR